MEDWMEPFARTIDAAKKYVVSSTLDRVDWNAELVRGDLGKAVEQLKRESGKGLFVAGVKLAQALAEMGLIDEYEFLVHPRLAGHGPTLFAGLSKRVDLKLVSRLEFGSGWWRCGMSRKVAIVIEVCTLTSRLSFCTGHERSLRLVALSRRIRGSGLTISSSGRRSGAA